MASGIDAYQDILKRWREGGLIGSVSALLSWDEQTYMPRGGGEHRANQLALLAGLRHDRMTDPRLGELLAGADSRPTDPLSDAAVNLREIRRLYARATRLPKPLVEELARVTSIAQQEWITARSRSDYAHARPWLDKMIALKRQEADLLRDGGARYDALLDEYEPGAKSAVITSLFDDLRRQLVPLVAAIGASARRPSDAILRRDFPVDRQRIFCEEAAASIGFDFHHGRLDTTAHPFCTGIGPGDTRLTTRFDPKFFSEGFFGTLHEAGHGIYDQGLPEEHFGTPRGDAVSLGIHESQSRLWENLVGRGKAFWRHFFPRAQQLFPGALGDASLDDFHAAVNVVQPSLIRVEADEVTYNLHVLIRFELEQAMIDGKLSTAELPGVWNELYKKCLGIVPPNDAAGCLQDIHWFAGLWGYFPTYTLGNLNAAQLYRQARADLKGLEEGMARGEFAPLLHWLRDRVHRHGMRFSSTELVQRATGAPPSSGPLLEHLRAKAREIYAV